jgi:hypothetical protein
MAVSDSDSRTIRYRFIRRVILILTPCLALGAWLAIAPSDRMAQPADAHYLPSLIYDEYDLTAMAQRGLNAEFGRKAGLLERPERVAYRHFSRYLASPHELEPRYFLEYPHTMLLMFRAGFWIQPKWREVPIPATLLDCDYQNIAAHDPNDEYKLETQSELRILRLFVVAARFYVSVLFVALLLLIAVLEWGYGEGTGLQGGSLLLLLPAALFFALNRYDVLPALMTGLAFAFLGRRYVVAAAIFLAIGTLIKVYPVLFAPLVLRYLWPNRRQAYRFGITYAAMGLLALWPLLMGDNLVSIVGPYRFQLMRPAEHGMILYGCVLPARLADGAIGAVFRSICLTAVMALMLATPIRDLASLLRRCGLVLLVFVGLAVFYSPQWILWFAPLLMPLATTNRRLAWGAALLDILTYVTFPGWYLVLPLYVNDVFGDLPYTIGGSTMTDAVIDQLGNALRFGRFCLIAFIGWQLARMEWRRTGTDSVSPKAHDERSRLPVPLPV